MGRVDRFFKWRDLKANLFQKWVIIFKIEFFKTFIDAAITLDGQTRINLSKGNIIYIQKAKFSAKLIAFSSDSYISALKNKLGWSGNFTNNTSN